MLHNAKDLFFSTHTRAFVYRLWLLSGKDTVHYWPQFLAPEWSKECNEDVEHWFRVVELSRGTVLCMLWRSVEKDWQQGRHRMASIRSTLHGTTRFVPLRTHYLIAMTIRVSLRRSDIPIRKCTQCFFSCRWMLAIAMPLWYSRRCADWACQYCTMFNVPQTHWLGCVDPFMATRRLSPVWSNTECKTQVCTVVQYGLEQNLLW
jgi:hypothetical protein